ncbi:MAG: tripartite tricarboxylate transporter substrate binding protein [Rhizobiales bacterium]|jgi:tripartite-type tricarboxylate transporter receptor subunit TctC|nr:tripartite tricarboxylate transporter substrate binding protein [Hyphomicrobiales bacterium]
MRRWLLGLGATAAAVLALSQVAVAQDYPNRTVKIVVPFSAGGSADAVPRIVADWLSRKWGQAIVIENKTGAAGNIGAEAVAKADPDGYTLLSAPPPPLVINQNLYPKLPFNPAEFIPIVNMASIPNALVVNPDRIKAKSIPEVIALAKANPGKITVATTGNGGTQHLTAEMFEMMAGVKFQHVPYRGSAPALADLVAGNVEMMFDNIGASAQLINAGKLKLIAVATAKRLKTMPNVPTIAETLPGFEAVAWFAIVAPAKTPMDVVRKINADVNEALHDPGVQAKLAKLNADVVGGTTEATAAYFKEEVARWGKVIKDAHITLN